MHGNAWQWVSDWYAADYYGHFAVDDPRGPATGKCHVRRRPALGLAGRYMCGRRSATSTLHKAGTTLNLSFRLVLEKPKH